MLTVRHTHWLEVMSSTWNRSSVRSCCCRCLLPHCAAKTARDRLRTCSHSWSRPTTLPTAEAEIGRGIPAGRRSTSCASPEWLIRSPLLPGANICAPCVDLAAPRLSRHRTSHGRPQAKDIEGQEPEPSGFGMDAQRSGTEPVSPLRCSEGSTRGVPQLRLVCRPPSPRGRLTSPRTRR